MTIAVETGVWMAVGIERKDNGEGEFSFDDDSRHFPENPRAWYANRFFAKVFGNVVFALFTEGLLQICDKVQNPLITTDEHAFPVRLYDVFLNNNCRALAYGYDSSKTIGTVCVG